MTEVFIAIVGAVLGIAIGYMAARIALAKRTNEENKSNAGLETQVAVLRSELDAEKAKVAEARNNAERQLETFKVDADKRIAEVKEDAARQIQQEKERSAQAIAAERDAGEKRFEKMKQEKDEAHQKAMDAMFAAPLRSFLPRDWARTLAPPTPKRLATTIVSM